ncbi:MAG: AarF/ABC1/UbiB kinase family protein [bacterium]
MSFPGIPRTWRHLRRYRQIITVFLKYGFDDVVDVVRKDLVLRFGAKIIPRLKAKPEMELTRAERLRCTAEELGPTFIKLGQILSMRPEIIPADIAFEFQQLQDQVTPLPFQMIKEVLERELSCNLPEIFASIEEEPLAAASIAQVHRGVLRNGTPVAIKVQRPGIEDVINVDIEILANLASLLARHSPELALRDPVGLVHEFDRSIHRELDFLQEGRNIQRFKMHFADSPDVFIPMYYPEYSSIRVIVMDFVDGIKVSNLPTIRAAGLDPVLISKRGTRLILKQIFEFGFFHADPHPGNIMVLPGNVIAPLDYGMVGYLTDFSVDELGNILVGIVRKDVERILRAFEQLGVSASAKNNPELREALSDFINRYYQVPLKQLQVTVLIAEIFQIIHKHRLRLPANLSLMIKALSTAEALGRMLNPNLDMITEARPYVKRLARRRFEPRRRMQHVLTVLDDMARLTEELPQALRDILQKINQGQLRVQFEHRNLENLIQELNRSSNHIASAMIIAALIVGSSLVMQVELGPRLFGFPLLGLVGYLLATLLGLKHIWDILRSRFLGS